MGVGGSVLKAMLIRLILLLVGGVGGMIVVGCRAVGRRLGGEGGVVQCGGLWGVLALCLGGRRGGLRSEGGEGEGRRAFRAGRRA